MRTKLLLMIWVCLAVGTMTAQAVTRYVPGEYPTIQAAIDDCSDGDIVIVEPGIYTGPGNRDIDFLGRDITVRSVDPKNPDCVDATIIDCQGTETELHRGFYFHSGEGADSGLEGFTITNGCAYKGGGIYCGENSSPTVTNCTFTGNSANDYGGGMYNWHNSPAITNCTFTGNSARWGGGMFNYVDSIPILISCTFSGNSGDIAGGGMVNVYGSPTVINCTFSGNSADCGGGMYNVEGSKPTLSNCILWGNTASSRNNEIYNAPTSSTPVISYCDIADCLLGGMWDPNMGSDGGGNIDTDPLFVETHGLDGIIGTEDDNLRLLPLSPCIDVGDNSVVDANYPDLDGNERVINGIVDMGAYEANPIEANLRMLPRVVNRRNRMRYIFAIVRLPGGVERNDIESDEMLTLYPGEIEAKRQHILAGRGRRKSDVRILGFFDKADFTAAVPENGRVEMDVVGRVKTGRYFYGTDEIRVIGRRNESSRRK